MALINGKLYSFQEEGVVYALWHHYAIIGFEQGLGKSVMAIYLALLNKSKRTVVVCPAFLRRTWEQEIIKFSKEKKHIAVCKNQTEIPAEFDFLICSYAGFKKFHSKLKDIDFVIADEVHYLKNIKAARTLAFHHFLQERQPDRFIGLSGTPIKNGVPDFYSLLLLCSYNPYNSSGININKTYSSYYKFCKSFCYVSNCRFGGVKFTGIKNISELKKLLEGKYIRKRVADCLDLPEMTAKEVFLDKRLNEMALAESWKIYSTKKKGTGLMSAKLVSANAKADFTVEYARNLLDSTDKVVIYSDHKEPVAKIHEGLKDKHRSVAIDGNMPTDTRSEYVNQFQNGKLDIIVSTIGALKEGVTLTASQHLIFNDISWVPGDNDQVWRRIYRISQTKNVFIHYILGGPVDQLILKVNLGKSAVIKKLL